MQRFIILFLAGIGLLVNMSFAGVSVQPDWSLGILVGVLLSHRSTWIWVLPSVAFHDLFLYWSIDVTLPFVAFVALVLAYSDIRLAPGQPQRWFSLFFACLPLLIAGLDVVSWLLTIMLTTWVWFLLSTRREKVYVEPA